ncbi:MAG: glycoside hydrolase family 127 protein [Oscillospiraceae bacterium]|jgi:DUF1680 family protein|nr:glycoside hydrolase family 127 protein [Oscillospiraceae bacterium]
MKSLPLSSIQLTEGLPQRMQRLVKDQVLPYQWDVLHDRVTGVAPSHCIENFRIAAGLAQGEHHGVVFLDSDLYKWLEAAAYCIELFGAEAQQGLAAQADEVCALIAQAQGPDGYINTYYTLKEPHGRFTNLQQGHELYCAGHLFEAAVAYCQATGKRAILDTACRFADYLARVFGTGEGQLPGYPGHQVAEVGLIKLCQATGNRSYLELAEYFIAQRGKQPHYFAQERQRPGYKDIFDAPVIRTPAYSQSHMEPVRQREAVGHAVRALYMYSAMADLAALTGSEALRQACGALYHSVTQRRMYITGAVGSTECGESFTVDFDLPNDTVYGESCASVGLMMFAARMAALTGEGQYYDTVERAFFNQVLGGISQTGREFFYVGPLAVNPAACRGNPGLAHVKPVRQRWFDVACCPTNIARTIMSIGRYAVGADEDTLYIHIPLACQIRTDRFAVALHTQYPFGDTLRLQVQERVQNLALRQSALAPIKALLVNGEARPLVALRGYLRLPGLRPGDVVEAAYDLTPRYVVSHPKVTANVGKAAVMRGPLVYCAEQADNGEGIACLRLPPVAAFTQRETFAGAGTVALMAQGTRAVFADREALHQDQLPAQEPAVITLIPYCLWANRGEGEMQVYLNLP